MCLVGFLGRFVPWLWKISRYGVPRREVDTGIQYTKLGGESREPATAQVP